jgi:hypothetical protein
MYPHRAIRNDVTICNVVTLPRNDDSVNMYVPRRLRFNFCLISAPTTISIKSGSFVIFEYFREEFTVKMSCDKHVYTHTHTHIHHPQIWKDTIFLFRYLVQTTLLLICMNTYVLI